MMDHFIPDCVLVQELDQFTWYLHNAPPLAVSSAAAPVTRIRKITPQIYQVVETPEAIMVPSGSICW
jgi:hypothetical protein